MTYTQTQELFEAMDNLEMYSKLWHSEVNKDDTDFDEMKRYRAQIQVQRERIFHVLDKSNDT
jgi:hypothetical protein